MSILEGAVRGLSLGPGRLAGGAWPLPSRFLTTGDTNTRKWKDEKQGKSYLKVT
jgi:hypothetical protein